MVQAAQKDLAAFDQIYVTYADPVFRYLFSRVGRRAEAEDLTAQTFLAALEGLPKYRHQGRLAAWLFSIARNKAIDHFRRERTNTSLNEIEERPDEKASVEIDGSKDQLSRLLVKLPEDELELLRLRYVAELEFPEIALVLKRNTDAVKKATYRLLARLQGEMEKSQ